ncbi:hypothetical protein ACMA1I_10800 [Pontibacter sp. 13R65]|uniref:hypothetical protein n=1 Tax=Pontibacter sp. 13R65 TaxID=3127458 RepID=UPI00301CB7AA
MNVKPFLLTAALAVGLTSLAKAQDVSVEKSIYGVQTGLLGIWAQNESRLSNKIALRSEIGLDAGLFGGGARDNMGFILTPVLNLEPRWYHNISKRAEKGKRTANNSANFLTAAISFHPDWFVISNKDSWIVHNQVAIIPTWGIRRVIGRHFTYETAVGFGYSYIFRKYNGHDASYGETAFNLKLRLGYTF